MYMAQTNYDGNITAFGRSAEHAFHTLWNAFKKRYSRTDDDRKELFSDFSRMVRDRNVSVIEILEGDCIQDNEHIYPYHCDKIIHFETRDLENILKELGY
jgi:hypothetical protein